VEGGRVAGRRALPQSAGASIHGRASMPRLEEAYYISFIEEAYLLAHRLVSPHIIYIVYWMVRHT